MEPDLTDRPRVVFLSSGGIIGDAVLSRLIGSERFEVVGVVRSRRVMIRGASFLRGALSYFARCGILYTVYIWTITTFAEFVGLFTGIGSITFRAKRHGLPILHTQDVNDILGLSFVRRCKPDLLISAHFDQRLYPPLCDGVEFAAVNLHPSLLPDHRGIEPVLQAMRRKDSKFGVSVHRLSETIDTGAILASQSYTPDQRHSVLRVTLDLERLGAELLAAHSDQALPCGWGRQQSKHGSYHSWPTSRQVRQLYFGGKQLLKPADLRLFWREL
jgi:methionyl-tRNA formyltransferase